MIDTADYHTIRVAIVSGIFERILDGYKLSFRAHTMHLKNRSHIHILILLVQSLKRYLVLVAK